MSEVARRSGVGRSRGGMGARRGGAYIVVLGATMIVTVIGLGALAAVRVNNAALGASAEMAEARLYADSAVEVGLLLVANDDDWRTNRPDGAWASNRPLADGTVTVEGTDPGDGVLANLPHDDLVLTGTGVKGPARHMTQVRLAAAPVPLPALAMAIHAAGQIQVKNGRTLTATGAPVSGNGNIRNDATINGSVEAATVLPLGTITGSVTLLAPTKALPTSEVAELYASIGTLINPSGTIDERLLTPTVNPWGAANADGVYVIRTNSDLVIRDCRIEGTLVVICPGRRVTIEDEALLHPFRADYPTLIVDGRLEIRTNGGVLSEFDESINFNPVISPYQGVSDSSRDDTYPNEVRGLVHVREGFSMIAAAKVRGVVLCESTATIDGTNEIIYDPAFFENPPMGYTSSVPMVIVPGSWAQRVLP